MDVKIEKKKMLKMPHAYAIMIFIIIIMCLLTFIIPAGTFERVYDEELDRELVVAGTYLQLDESSPVGPWGFFISLYSGVVESAEIIFFIVFATAYAMLLQKTGTLNAMVGAMLRKLGNKDVLMIPIFMVLFGLAGTSFGMYEETYALIPAFMVIAVTLGYDRLVGGSMVFVGVATGFAAAILNPFTIGIASSIAGINLVGSSVTPFRILAFILFEALAIAYTMRYAIRIKKDPTKSFLYGTEEPLLKSKDVKSRDEVMQLEFTLQQKFTLGGFILLIILMGVTCGVWGWYLYELAALFIVFFLVTSIINGYSVNKICETFVEAAEAAMFGALLVGFARSINVVMENANIIDTCVNAIAGVVSSLPKGLSAVGMLVVQNAINFFIPSGSGQAVVMMPIMAPLSDLLGLSRELAVVCYQFGDGFSNMFWPTAVATECGIMGIAMDKWYKYIGPLFGMMFVLQAILVTIGVAVL